MTSSENLWLSDDFRGNRINSLKLLNIGKKYGGNPYSHQSTLLQEQQKSNTANCFLIHLYRIYFLSHENEAKLRKSISMKKRLETLET